MRQHLAATTVAALFSASAAWAEPGPLPAKVVHFSGNGQDLGGELFLPAGSGPFPAVLWNHGSAAGMLSSQASQAIGPRFAEQGWIFFMPYRRGQGLSADAGPYIVDEIAAARRRGGRAAAADAATHLLATDHLQDQMTALRWLQSQPYVQTRRIAVAGNSFGGIQALLGAAQGGYCAAVDAAGGAESWSLAPSLQTLMKSAVRDSRAPLLFLQAANDFDLSPSKHLLAEAQSAGKSGQMKIYPAFGSSATAGHSFAYAGVETWFGDVFEFLRAHCPP